MKKHIAFALSMMMATSGLAAGGDGPGNSEKKTLSKIQTQLNEAVRDAKAQALLPYEVTDYVRGDMGLSEKQQYIRQNNALGGASNARGGPTSLLLQGGPRDREFNFGRESSISANIEVAIQRRTIDLGTANFLRENWVRPLLKEREASLAQKENATLVSDREGLKNTVQKLNRISDMLIGYIQSEQMIEENSYIAVKRVVNPKKDSNANDRVQVFLEKNLVADDQKSGLVDKLLKSSYGITEESPRSAKADSLNLYKKFAIPMLQIGLAAADYHDFRASYGKIPYLDSNPYFFLPSTQVDLESRMYAIGTKIGKNSQILAMIMREPLITAAVGYGENARFTERLSEAEKKQVSDFQLKNPEVSKLLKEMVAAGNKWDLLDKDGFKFSLSFETAKRANTKGLLATVEVPNYEQNFKLSSNVCIKALR